MARVERKDESDGGEGGVEGHFGVRQFDMEGVGDGFDEGIAWDAEEVRKDLADDASGEKYRAKEKKGELGEVDVGDEGARRFGRYKGLGVESWAKIWYNIRHNRKRY